MSIHISYFSLSKHLKALEASRQQLCLRHKMACVTIRLSTAKPIILLCRQVCPSVQTRCSSFLLLVVMPLLLVASSSDALVTVVSCYCLFLLMHSQKLNGKVYRSMNPRLSGFLLRFQLVRPSDTICPLGSLKRIVECHYLEFRI